MVLINSTTMQATAKVVYYGPGLCGKTTNLAYIHSKTAPGTRGEMISLETETDRTLFFDLLPLEVGFVGGMKVRLQLYTVPGQVFYNTTRKMVLKNVDGIVFVADSQEEALEANIQSLQNLQTNLAELGMRLEDVPLVLQYNKRDLRQITPVEVLQSELNPEGLPHFEAAARHGLGVFETLKGISRLALLAVRQKIETDAGVPAAAPVGPPPPRVANPSLAAQPAVTVVPPPAREVEFAEENTARDGLRPVHVQGDTALREELQRVRTRNEIERRASIRIPADVLRACSRIGVHLSLQGEDVKLRDALTIRLSPSELSGRLRLRLDLEIDATE